MNSGSTRLKKVLSSVTLCSTEALAYSQCVLKSANTVKGTCQKEFVLLEHCMKIAAKR